MLPPLARCFFKKRDDLNVGWSCLHLNFSSLMASMRRRCIRFGPSHLAPEVSIGFRCRYSASQRKLQSQMKGFRPRCLRNKKQKQISKWVGIAKKINFQMSVWQGSRESHSRQCTLHNQNCRGNSGLGEEKQLTV